MSFRNTNKWGIAVINVNSLLSYYRNNPNYVVKKVKGSDFNIEFRHSLVPRKNVLVKLYPKTGRFYLNKGRKWINISKLPEITDADVIAWVEKDSHLCKLGPLYVLFLSPIFLQQTTTVCLTRLFSQTLFLFALN